ncbi:MAG TPA: ATP-binding protein [Bryobacteraceae bacterium]|nr:ATP-binding protein [Bryobacteraceae bacterium]
MLRRARLEKQLRQTLRTSPITALLGPRQCGKTTLARAIARSPRAEYFDLEDPVGVQRLAEPMTALGPLRGLIVIDEIQRRPDLFPVLRVLADRSPSPARFLILGSASPELLRQGSETLAGRIAFLDMGGFDLSEVGANRLRRLWWRGGFPRSFLAATDEASNGWRQDFIRTFLERDIREFGVQIPAPALRRFWMMLAHCHGQIWNGSEIARSLAVSHTTVKTHLDVLTSALMIRQLQPFHENLGKRQVKSPKIYLRDSGLLHSLLGLESFADLEGHPKLGASWEGFALNEVVRLAGERNVFFWATRAGAEIDLLITARGRRFGVEIKYGDAPGLTKSMRIARTDLGLDRLLVIYPGSESYDLDETARVVPVTQLEPELAPRRPSSPLRK